MFGSSVLPFTCGPLIPYLVGSTIGYGLGGMFMWNTELHRALTWTRLYPKLVEHNLEVSHRDVGAGEIVSQVKKGNRLSLGQMSWLILGSRAAMSDMMEVESHKASKLVEEYIGEE